MENELDVISGKKEQWMYFITSVYEESYRSSGKTMSALKTC